MTVQASSATDPSAESTVAAGGLIAAAGASTSAMDSESTVAYLGAGTALYAGGNVTFEASSAATPSISVTVGSVAPSAAPEQPRRLRTVPPRMPTLAKGARLGPQPSRPAQSASLPLASTREITMPRSAPGAFSRAMARPCKPQSSRASALTLTAMLRSMPTVQSTWSPRLLGPRGMPQVRVPAWAEWPWGFRMQRLPPFRS